MAPNEWFDLGFNPAEVVGALHIGGCRPWAVSNTDGTLGWYIGRHIFELGAANSECSRVVGKRFDKVAFVSVSSCTSIDETVGVFAFPTNLQ